MPRPIPHRAAAQLPHVFDDTSLGYIHDGMLKGQVRQRPAWGRGAGALCTHLRRGLSIRDAGPAVCGNAAAARLFPCCLGRAASG